MREVENGLLDWLHDGCRWYGVGIRSAAEETLVNLLIVGVSNCIDEGRWIDFGSRD